MFHLIQQNIARHITLMAAEFDYFTSLLKARRLRKKQFLLQEGEVCHYESFDPYFYQAKLYSGIIACCNY